MGKKLWAVFLSVLMLLGAFSACGAKQPENAQTNTPTVPTEPEEEAKALKVLTLGSSSSVDSNHMVNLVAHAEGFDRELKIATLYYSGCTLAQHVKFMNNDERVYKLYVSSTATPDRPPEIMDGITMTDALKFDYWDVIVLQAGGFEADEESSFTNGNIQAIMAFANEKKHNPLAKFAWHFIGAPATDPDLLSTFPLASNPYVEQMEKYNNSRREYYEARSVNIGKYILTNENFQFVVCSGTATMNASTTYLTEKDLLRDYTHATDLGRVIAAYTWYAQLAGIEQLEEIKLDAIPRAFLNSTVDKTKDRPITEAEKAIILESVNNALKNPVEITQSQYTQAPAQ